MKKPQFTVRSLSNNQNKTKSIFRLALLGPVFFLLASDPALSEIKGEIKIAFIDTGLCLQNKIIPNVTIDPVLDLTETVNMDCANPNIDKKSPRYHGQFVVDEFIKYYTGKSAIHLYPLIVFNGRGEQKSEYWVKAIDWIKKNKIDFVVSASGIITNDKIGSELPAIWFVSSGRITPQIKKETSLYPQNTAPRKNLFLIGDYFDGNQPLYDQGLLYQEKIDYYFPSGTTHFSGTSRAVAEAAAHALSVCPINSMRLCLKKLRKELTDNISHKKISTF